MRKRLASSEPRISLRPSGLRLLRKPQDDEQRALKPFERVRIECAERARFVPIDPPPQGYRIGPAPHSATDLAAILGQWYELPDWLEAVRPRGEPEADDDGRDVELIY